MNTSFVAERKDLLESLLSSSKLMEKSHTMRVVTHPWKMLYPQLFKITKRKKEVRIKTFWGGEMEIIFPEVVSTAIWRYGYLEADVCLFMLNCLREGMTFIDIGAHFGFFTLLGSYLVGRSGKVLAIEPTISTYRQLQKNVAKYCHNANVETYNCAAFSEETEIKLHDYGFEYSAYNSLFGPRKTDSACADENLVTVKTRKIDDLLKEKKITCPDFIKIDAESSEVHILNGMMETLKKHRPSIVLEVGDFGLCGVPSSREIITMLQQMNYSAYEIRKGVVGHHVLKDRYGYGNLLFVADK